MTSEQRSGQYGEYDIVLYNEQAQRFIVVENRLVYVGNSSKTGAYMTLMSEKMKAKMEALASDIEYMELAETENYERIFTESMIFPGKKGGSER